MKKSHVIFGYSTEDVVADINRTAQQVTGRVNPKSVKCLVKRPNVRKANYSKKVK